MSVADDCSMGAEMPQQQPTILPGGISRTRVDSEVTNADSANPEKHRIAEIRRRQGVSIRSAARRMGVSMERVRREEQADSDLSLSDLARWQRALDVPLIDLLVDNDAPVSSPVLTRAKWLKLMKTIKALLEVSPSMTVTRMVKMLESQVLEVMPELEDVGAWHSVGQRRTQDELGKIAEQPVPGSFASDGLK